MIVNLTAKSSSFFLVSTRNQTKWLLVRNYWKRKRQEKHFVKSLKFRTTVKKHAQLVKLTKAVQVCVKIPRLSFSSMIAMLRPRNQGKKIVIGTLEKGIVIHQTLSKACVQSLVITVFRNSKQLMSSKLKFWAFVPIQQLMMLQNMGKCHILFKIVSPTFLSLSSFVVLTEGVIFYVILL